MWAQFKEPSSLKDGWNLFKKSLKYKRLSNPFRIYWSFKRSGNKLKIKGMPVSVAFEPTTSCNLRCPQCPSGLRSFSRDTGMLDPSIFEQYIEENYRTLLYLLLYFQGEPYLHPQFFDLVKFVHSK